MLTGYNHNVRYGWRVFHVQTEDSGEKKPLIITHLFLGGDIVHTKKTDYRDLIDAPDRDEHVRHMMDSQHREMLSELLSGALDKLIFKHDSTIQTAPESCNCPPKDSKRSTKPFTPLTDVPPVHGKDEKRHVRESADKAQNDRIQATDTPKKEKSFDLLVLEFLGKDR